MIARLTSHLRRFGRKEDGQILVEFVLAVPLIFTLFMTSVELGIYAMRHMWLDRGLDVTVRAVRLGTGSPGTHDQIKQMICAEAGFLEDCDNVLRLEMVPVDPRNFGGFNQAADCVDTSQPVQPVRSFVAGTDHQLMLLRACYKFRPVFPTTGLGKSFDTDGSGRVRLISTSGFVQEPS